MPVYEYRCNDCAETFDALRSLNDRDRPAPCPRCAGTSSMPLISRPSPSPKSLNQAMAALPTTGEPSAGSGCCGGGCGCG